MENGEKMLLSLKDRDDSGYSEKKVDKDIELQAGQWLDLKSSTKASSAKQRGRPSKQKLATTSTQSPQNRVTVQGHKDALVLSIQDLSREIHDETEAYLKLIDANNDEAEEVFQRISTHQSTLRSLLKALKWEKKGQLDISKLPKEVQNLLK